MSWQRSLEFFKQENVLLKYRLSEMVDDAENTTNLQAAEQFQNEFLRIDDMLEGLTKSMLQLSLIPNPGEENIATLEAHGIMREKIHAMEKKCVTLALEFNKKMLPASIS